MLYHRDSTIGTSQRRHWRVFNVAMRVVGLWWTFGGLVVLGWALYFVFHPADLPLERTISGSPSIDFSIIGALVTSLGLYGVIRRPYRPDLGDTFFRGSRQSGFPWLPPVVPPSGPRSWWTGEPATSAHDDYLGLRKAQFPRSLDVRGRFAFLTQQ
jgi:hypothetical protein